MLLLHEPVLAINVILPHIQSDEVKLLFTQLGIFEIKLINVKIKF